MRMEVKFRVKMAGEVIEVQPLTASLSRFCKDYLTDKAPDHTVLLTEEDLIRERSFATEPASDAYLETLALCRRIATELLPCGTILLHGSCVAVDGAGYLFTADSGVGKSTHARLWRDLLGDRVVMINDDKPFVKITENGVTAYGSPWDGVHHLSTNGSVPVKAICLLHRDAANQIEPIRPEEAYPNLLEQTYRPAGRKAMEQLLPLVDRLTKQTGLYTLGCNQNLEAAKIAYAGMKENRTETDVSCVQS